MNDSSTVQFFDIFGRNFPIHMFGKKKYKTRFGALVGSFSIFLIISTVCFFFLDLINKNTMTIVSNQDLQIIPVNNLSSYPFIVTLVDASGIPIRVDEGIYNLFSLKSTANWSNYSFISLTHQDLGIKPCQREDFDYLKIIDNSNYSYCISSNTKNLTLFGSNNDIVNGWSLINVYLTKCHPKYQNCKNQSVINQRLEGAYLAIGTGMYFINNNNRTFPFFYNLKAETFRVSTSMYKFFLYYISKNIYTDDNGFVFESLFDHSFFSSGGIVSDVTMNAPKPSGILKNFELVSCVTLINSPYVLKTRRTFTKFQTLLANVGGIIKFIMTCGELITYFFTRKLIFIDIANSVFDFGKEPSFVFKPQHQIFDRNFKDEKSEMPFNNVNKINLNFRKSLGRNSSLSFKKPS
jgi:hypothetical protein